MRNRFLVEKVSDEETVFYDVFSGVRFSATVSIPDHIGKLPRKEFLKVMDRIHDAAMSFSNKN